MIGNSITITGNLADDPELTFTPTGIPVVKFAVGVSERRRTPSGEWEDGDTTWFRVTVWRDMGENVAASLIRGNRVTVTGTMRSRSYEDKEGVTRTAWEITADDVAASMRFAEVRVHKTARNRPNRPDTAGQWDGMDTSRERPASADTGSERPGESASPAGTAESDAGSAKPGAASTASRKGSRSSTATVPATASGEPPF